MSVFQGAAGLSRRGFLIGAGGLAAATVLTACGSGDQPAASSGPWEFTDDRGQKASRPQRPANLVTIRPRAERDVQKDDVEVLGARPIDRGTALWDREDVVPLPREGPRQHLP